MVIGLFNESYPPHIDGVGMVVRAYAQAFTKEGHTCYYVAPKNRDKRYAHSDQEEEYPIKLYNSFMLPKEEYAVGMPMLDWKYRREIKKIPFDIVHAHTPFLSGLETKRIAKRRHIPLIATLHSKYYDDFMAKTHSKLFAKLAVRVIVRFYNRCDEVWAVNQATADMLRGYGYKKEIVVMENGTDLWYPTPEDEKKAEEQFNLGSGNVFLFVGQHNYKKNIKSIIEATALYHRSHEDFRLVFVGQGPDAEKMAALTRTLGLEEHTVFTGHITDRETMKCLYARADLFLFPSLYDTAGLVVREAAAAGTPSLLIEGSDAAQGITDGDNGFLCKNTPEDICACMERALLSAKEVGARARQTIPIPWSRITQEAMKRYEMLIERKKTEKKGKKR